MNDCRPMDADGERAVTAEEIIILHDLYEAVISNDVGRFAKLVTWHEIERNLDLRRALTLLSLYVISKSFPRWRLIGRWPPKSVRSRIVNDIDGGIFGELIDLQYSRKLLEELGDGRPHNPIDTTPAGALSYVVMGATCLSRQAGRKKWERLFEYLMRRFQQRVRFRINFREVDG